MSGVCLKRRIWMRQRGLSRSLQLSQYLIFKPPLLITFYTPPIGKVSTEKTTNHSSFTESTHHSSLHRNTYNIVRHSYSPPASDRGKCFKITRHLPSNFFPGSITSVRLGSRKQRRSAFQCKTSTAKPFAAGAEV